MPDKKEGLIQELRINSSTIIGSQFAHVVSVAVTSDKTVTLDFAFVHPRDKSKGETVARITIPVVLAARLSDLLRLTIKAYENKEKGVKNE